jgi:hypothetical protein
MGFMYFIPQFQAATGAVLPKHKSRDGPLPGIKRCSLESESDREAVLRAYKSQILGSFGVHGEALNQGCLKNIQ